MNEQKVAVITGGTKGIGKALTDLFLQDGFTVYTVARNIESLENEDKSRLKAFKADLGIKKEVQAFADWVASQTEKVDVLINNAGIYIPGKISDEEEFVFEKQMNVNLNSVYYLTRKLLPLLDRSDKASIFNICSTASITPYINGGSYCISKYALYGLTKVLREELKPRRIAVSAVLPGATLTASWDGTSLPPSRFIDPKTVAQLIFTSYKMQDNSVMEEIIIRPMDGDIS